MTHEPESIPVADPRPDRVLARARELRDGGLSLGRAFKLAFLESQVEQWPTDWGDDFVAIIGGDFDPPSAPMAVPPLRATVLPGHLGGTVFSTARTVLKVRLQVGERSLASVKDAARRMNVLVGCLSYLHNGATMRWWSHITHPGGGSASFDIASVNPSGLLSIVDVLPEDVRRRFVAALYWIREPGGLLFEQVRREDLSVFAGYWNAFECGVDAADALEPMRRLTRIERAAAIRAHLGEPPRTPTPDDIATLHRTIVDPGFRARAEHVLRLTTHEAAAEHIRQCFGFDPKDHGLYAIRNAINHGTVDVDDPEIRILIEDRFPSLWKVVFGVLDGTLRLAMSRAQGSDASAPRAPAG